MNSWDYTQAWKRRSIRVPREIPHDSGAKENEYGNWKPDLSSGSYMEHLRIII